MSKVDKYRNEIKNSPKTSQTAKAKKPKTKDNQILNKDPGATSNGTSTNDGINILTSLLQATIFFDYFEHVAHKTYQGGRVDLKIVKLKTVHPYLHIACIVSDFAVRLLGFVAVFALAILTAYKVLIK